MQPSAAPALSELGSALATTGVGAILRRASVDPDDCSLVDVVCSAKGSGVGRALLAQLLIDMKRRRSTCTHGGGGMKHEMAEFWAGHCARTREAFVPL